MPPGTRDFHGAQAPVAATPVAATPGHWTRPRAQHLPDERDANAIGLPAEIVDAARRPADGDRPPDAWNESSIAASH